MAKTTLEKRIIRSVKLVYYHTKLLNLVYESIPQFDRLTPLLLIPTLAIMNG